VTRILGIDPGSVTTGIGIIDAESNRLIHVHHTDLKVVRDHFPDRLRAIFDQVSGLIHEYQPDEVAVEDVFVSKSAQAALKLGQARGAAICAAVAMSKPVAEYAPRLVKQAVVGKGSAEKQQVQHMVGILLNQRTQLQADAADALGVAICHAHHRGVNQRLATASRGGSR